jgi:hypothetical protein
MLLSSFRLFISVYFERLTSAINILRIFGFISLLTVISLSFAPQHSGRRSLMIHARSHFKGARVKHDCIIIGAFARVVIEPRIYWRFQRCVWGTDHSSVM